MCTCVQSRLQCNTLTDATIIPMLVCAQARVPPSLLGRAAQYVVEEEEFRDILDTASAVERPGAGTNMGL